MREFSEVAVLAWNIAGAEALSANFMFIEKEHLFVSLTEINKLLEVTSVKLNFDQEQSSRAKTENALIEQAFESGGIDMKRLRRDVRYAMGEGNHTGSRGNIHRSEACKKIFLSARLIAGEGRSVTGLHLLEALVSDPGPVVLSCLKNQSADSSTLLASIRKASAAMTASSESSYSKEAESPVSLAQIAQVPMSNPEFIRNAGKDLVYAAAKGDLGVYAVREDELSKIVSAFVSGDNPLLVGPDGIGKENLINLLAVRIANRQVPKQLLGVSIIDLGADSFFKPEENLNYRQVMENYVLEAASNSKVITAIPGLDKFMDSSRDGAASCLLIFRDTVIKGELRVIATISADNYKKMQKSDPELLKHFEKISISEPNAVQLLDILKAARSRLEVQHRVKINDSAINAAISLSAKFHISGCQPNKSIQILEQACQSAAVPILQLPDDVVRDMALCAQRFALDMMPDVNEMWVAHTVAKLINAPLSVTSGYLRGTLTRVAEIEKALNAKVYGQGDVLVRIAKTVVANELSQEEREPLVFVLFGPSGSGKTHLIRTLPDLFFGDETALLYFDMSQYGQESLKKMFAENGTFEEMFCRQPYSVVAFDGAEKAPPVFYELLNTFLSRKEIISPEGRSAIVSNAVFVVASNIFTELQFSERNGEKVVIEQAAKTFSRFAGWMSNAVVFKPLGEATAKKILLEWMDELSVRLKKDFDVTLHLGRESERHILEHGVDERMGAKQLRLILDEQVFMPVQRAIERGSIKRHRDWTFSVVNNKLSLHPKTHKARTDTGRW